MSRGRMNLLRALVSALLLCALGGLFLAAYASPSGPAPAPPAAGDQACYTIDTTRFEWLSYSVYLPVVLKSHG
jgi:hypothetical protein